MLGQLGLVTSEAMLSQWRYVVVGATAAAAVLTPSTDPFTQVRLAGLASLDQHVHISHSSSVQATMWLKSSELKSADELASSLGKGLGGHEPSPELFSIGLEPSNEGFYNSLLWV
jgi:hypothetical protein